jgi:Leucine-rich repeat (LRR) protein
LKELSLPDQVTDAGLLHLAGMRSLTILFLEGTQISDAGLAHLKGLSNLQKLYLGNTRVTDAGVADLQKALSDCRIYH